MVEVVAAIEREHREQEKRERQIDAYNARLVTRFCTHYEGIIDFTETPSSNTSSFYYYIWDFLDKYKLSLWDTAASKLGYDEGPIKTVACQQLEKIKDAFAKEMLEKEWKCNTEAEAFNTLLSHIRGEVERVVENRVQLQKRAKSFIRCLSFALLNPVSFSFLQSDVAHAAQHQYSDQ